MSPNISDAAVFMDKIDGLRVKQLNLTARAADVEAEIVRGGVERVEGELDKAVFREDWDSVKVLVRAVGRGWKNLIRWYKELLKIRGEEVGGLREELSLVNGSYQKTNTRLEAVLATHAQMAVYTALLVRERKAWQVTLPVETDLTSTKGFYCRCREVAASLQPGLKTDFGDPPWAVADRYMADLIERSRTYRVGCADEIKMLETLINTLLTGTTEDGQVLDVGVLEQKRKFDLQERDNKWVKGAAKILRKVENVRPLLHRTRSDILEMTRLLHHNMVTLVQSISDLNIAYTTRITTTEQLHNKTKEALVIVQGKFHAAASALSTARADNAALSVGGPLIRIRPTSHLRNKISAISGVTRLLYHHPIPPRPAIGTYTSTIAGCVVILMVKIVDRVVEMEEEEEKRLQAERDEIAAAAAVRPATPIREQAGCMAVMALLTASQTATKCNATYRDEKLEELVQYQDKLASEFEATLTKYSVLK